MSDDQIARLTKALEANRALQTSLCAQIESVDEGLRALADRVVSYRISSRTNLEATHLYVLATCSAWFDSWKMQSSNGFVVWSSCSLRAPLTVVLAGAEEEGHAVQVCRGPQ